MVKNIDKESITIEKDGNFSFAKNAKMKMPFIFLPTKYLFHGRCLKCIKAWAGGRQLTNLAWTVWNILQNHFKFKRQRFAGQRQTVCDLIADKADMHYWMNTGNLRRNDGRPI